MEYEYDDQGYLNKIKENDGNGSTNLLTSITYDHQEGIGKDKVSEIINSFGNKLTYTYDTTNKQTTVTDENGRTWIYWYDSCNFITKSQEADGQCTENEVNKFGETISTIDRNGNETQYIRDAQGNAIKIIQPDASIKEYTYDEKNNLKSEKDEMGNYTYYIYDSQNINLLKKIQPLNGTEDYNGIDDPTQFAVTTYEYYTEQERTQLGYKIKGLVKSATDPEGGKTNYTYTQYGYVKTVSDPRNASYLTVNGYNSIGWKLWSISPEGFRTDYTYDSNGLIEKITQQNGETTRITYDAGGRKTKEITPNLYNPALDNLTNHTYTGDHGTRYTYNAQGKLQTITDAENYITSYTYDKYGNITTETKPNSAQYIYEYDPINRLKKVSFKENDTAAPALLEEYSYDILPDKRTQKTHTTYLNDTETAVTVFIYDYAGRLVEQFNPDGTMVKTDYNANGTIKSKTDENGSSTYYEYDGLNRITNQWTPIEQTQDGNKYTYTEITYDNAGRKTQEKIGKEKVDAFDVPLSYVIKDYTYWENGKLKSATDSAGRKTEYYYDKDGTMNKEEVYRSQTERNITEYKNNHFGKPDSKKQYVKAGDIYPNGFNDTQDLILTTAYTYDKNGNLETVTTPDNITTTYSYDQLNQQTGISQPGKDEYGDNVEITTMAHYNWEGKPEYAIDAKSIRTDYAYTPRGFLQKATVANTQVTAYYYDTAGRKIAEVQPLDYIEGMTLPEMNRTEYDYDVMGRLQKKSDIYKDSQGQWVTVISKAYEYDKRGNVIKEQDALGYEGQYGTQYTYNLAGKIITILDPVSEERGLAFAAEYQYDALGRKVSETNAKGITTSYHYDDAGNVQEIRINVKPNPIKKYSYDLAGNVLTEQDGNGNTITYEYNGLNKIRKVIYPMDNSIPTNVVTYQYDQLGNMCKTAATIGTEEIYTYDNQGRQLSHTQQKQDGTEAITIHIKYDKNGNKRFETDGNGVTQENIYDDFNRLTDTKVIVSGIEQVTSYTYDANGNLLTQSDWKGNTYTNIYDPLNRLIEKQDPYGKIIQRLEYNKNNIQTKSYDALNNSTQYFYDKNNRLIKTIDPEGHKTEQTYDDAGNISTKTDGRNITTTYRYDESNRLVEVVNAKSEITSYVYDNNGNMLAQTDGKGNTTLYEYNVMNKPVRRIDHGGRQGTPGNYTYDFAKTESYTYYADGSLKNKTDRNGKTFTYTYDSHGRMTSQAVENITISYTYDNNGNQLTMTDSTGTTTRTYDELNRAKTKLVPGIGTSVYQYDIISGVGQGEWAETTTDPKGNITKKVYDKTGRLKTVTADGKTTTYTYYDNGSRQSIIYPDGSKEEYTYYRDTQLKTLTNKKANGTVLETFSYTYDGAHNQVAKTDQKGITAYTYDSLNRLETVTEPGGKQTSYTYDKAGNRENQTITQSGNTIIINYTYNEQNRLIRTVTEANGTTETVNYSYDYNGNMLTSAKSATDITIYEYNDLNQMVKTMIEDKTILETYNGEGLRVSKTVNGQTTKYLYEYDKVVLEVDGNGNQTARNVYGTNLLARTIGGQTLYYFYNGHGDVTALADAAGTIKATYYYDAFGVPTEETGDANNPIRYAGYQYDDETGLYYLNARMYDPEIARFLQEDTYRGNAKDPLTLNLYTYCANNPVLCFLRGTNENIVNSNKSV